MKLNFILTLIALQFLFISCMKDDNITLVLPEVVHITPIEEIIPPTVLQNMENYMPIYDGTTPPNIEGSYKISTTVLVYTSDGLFSAGDVFVDKYIRFWGQNLATHVLSYEQKEVSSTGTVLATGNSELVAVTGSGNNFTAYFITTGKSSDIYTKTATIISGTKTASGITNLYNSFVMLDKGADPDEKIIDINVFRVFKDLDGTAVNYSWSKSGTVSDKNKFLDIHSASK